ncbi:MAG: polysaccharide deacetylase family protein [Deltaproteobacteria bacterium]|nr:polysaccharide deacetylase family protein [Deltaproteobacteria bacterium]
MSALRAVADGVSATPLANLTWRLRKSRRKSGRALVLMYHRVSSEPDYLGMSVTPERFEEQMQLLRRRTRVVPLVDLVGKLGRQQPLEEDLTAITFDDGYRDNLETALPILERHGLPATVFVTTDFLDDKTLPDGERLRQAFEHLWADGSAPALTSDATGSIAPAIRRALAKPGSFDAVREVRQKLKHLPANEIERVMATLEQRSGTAEPKSTPAGLMLHWHEVRVLAARGVEIGSHTVSHAILSRVTDSVAARELRESKQRLEEATGKPVVGFAYPNGQATDFSQTHVSALRQLGYVYACSAVRGINRPGSDLFRLRRIGVGNHSAALLDLKLALGGPVQPCAA